MNDILHIKAVFAEDFSAAQAVSKVPLVRDLTVTNESDQSFTDLELRLHFDPAFAEDVTVKLSSVGAGETLRVTPIKLNIDLSKLMELTETVQGKLFASVWQGEEALCRQQEEIRLLPPDIWNGTSRMPETVCAFVTSRAQSVSALLQSASQLLQQWTGSAEFLGYQMQDNNNVKQQAAAIFEAIKAAEIGFVNPPVSFESGDIRIKTPDVLLSEKKGTCLDLAVLYCSCLEAAGLAPLLFFMKGHVFAGAWLEEQSFADCVTDDVTAIQKRLADQAEELLCVECTDMVAGRGVQFDTALMNGKSHFSGNDVFDICVDVRRSRASAIGSVSVSEGEAGFVTVSDELSAGAPAAIDSAMLGTATGERVMTKQKMWERKLLDFSLRNSLLNFRATKNTLRLVASDLHALEDIVWDEKDLLVCESPTQQLIISREDGFEPSLDMTAVKSISEEELKSSRIRTFISKAELERTLKSIFRAAKTAIEENGSNTLFLALGFLKWYETDVSQKPRYAPLILVPVDLVKSIRNHGYVIRTRQEDPQINITLLEYLRQDHGIEINGLDPLPIDDENGTDTALVFNTIRQAIMNKSRWNILDYAYLGLFSFGQFVMWNDIRNRADELEKNKIVSSLVKGAITWTPQEQTVTPENCDTTVSMADVAVPMIADSSQLTAVVMASKGESFVLHGPPGTGKSQTITNMIANALYQGKSVLFAAEKMAALNVVKKRLAGIGLDPFCLELHSNKTNKSVVLGQLEKALEVGRIKPAEEYEATAARCEELKRELNHIMDALHAKRRCGVSLYDSIGIFRERLQYKDMLSFDDSLLSSLDEAQLARITELTDKYASAAAEIGIFAEHPFRTYNGSNYSIELRDEFERECRSLLSLADAAQSGLGTLNSVLPVQAGTDRRSADALCAIAEACSIDGTALSSLIGNENISDIQQKLYSLCNEGNALNASKAELLNTYEADILNLDANSTRRAYREASAKWFIPRHFGVKKIVRSLDAYAKKQGTVTKENVSGELDKLCALMEKRQLISSADPNLTAFAGAIWQGESTDFNTLSNALSKTASLDGAFRALGARPTGELPAYTQQMADAKTAIEAYTKACDTLSEKHKIDFSAEESAQSWITDIRTTIDVMLANLADLRERVIFTQAEAPLRECGLTSVCAAYRTGKVPTAELSDAMLCCLHYSLALKYIREDERLSSFSGKQAEDIIARYAEVTERYRTLTVTQLVSKLSANIPNTMVGSAASSEVGILKKAIKNNGRMLSIRKLFEQIPTLLRRLCPCMLMSPISVAQYIDPTFPKFDLVIFDEASQLPTSEAVGTIARADNAIIVGDPKQLPPTSFFKSDKTDEDNAEHDDLESLLDDCLALSMPQEYLKWHYRSKHESLIAFSNMKYYDNKLYTFPSPRDMVSQVKLVQLDGFYDKGSSKQNRAEAEAVVAEIMRRLRDEKLRNDSIGVVTFSLAQQTLIEDLLEDEFNANPDIAEFDAQSKEPVFVKNLENVQGDERDVILFSIGYGPDKDGKVSMNFGPINREGGWRRLNVAVTRSKKEMIIYSVLRPEQIDLSRTRSQGAEGLKAFLEFAQRGRNINVADRTGISKEPIVNEIADRVRELGYECNCSIGASEYKLDIGVIDPENKDEYMLGIMLDGKTCYNTPAAKDRFISQPSVLEGLGWRICRVWTLDWFDEPERVMAQIKDAIANAKAPIVKQETQKEEPVFIQEAPVEAGLNARPYVSTKITELGTMQDFYNEANTQKSLSLMTAILETEAPIERNLFMKKVFSAWGISRSTQKAETHFAQLMGSLSKQLTVDSEHAFIWGGAVNTAFMSYYRTPTEQMQRSAEEIASQEYTCAALEVLDEQLALSESDLIRETAKKFGFTRLTAPIENTVRFALTQALQSGRIVKLDNGNYSRT